MPIRDVPFYEALKAYTGAAVKLARERAAGTSFEKLRRESEFFSGTGTGRGRAWFGPWQMHLIQIDQELHALSEYATCLDRIKANRVIAGQLNQFVGNGDLHAVKHEPQISDAILFDLPHQESGLVFDDGEFDRLYETLENDLYSEFVTVEVVAPLRAFVSDRPEVPLDDSTRISAFARSELDHAPQMLTPPSKFSSARFAVRAKYQSRKIIGEANETQVGKATDQRLEATDTVERALVALNVFKPGPVVPEGIIVHSPSVLGVMHFTSFPVAPYIPLTNSYRLSERDADLFPQFWRRLNSPEVARFTALDVALRRFAFANGRTRPEDCLVDMVIAGEALFLSSGGGDPKYKGEIRYRFSINAALLGISKQTPEQVFRLFREAYDLRSSLVHGGDEPDKARLPDGSKVSLRQFVAALEEPVREMLHRSIDRAADPMTPKSRLWDWDQLLMSRLNPS